MYSKMIKQLSDEQLTNFNVDYLWGWRWHTFKELIEKHFPDGGFTFLDVGGGNGMTTDKLLNLCPNAQGTVLDNSQLLLDANTKHPRKTCIYESAEKIGKLKKRYDLISIHWLLHHLVGDDYEQSRRYIASLLNTIPALLTKRGRVSIFENCYNGWPFDNLPNQLIFKLTASKRLMTVVSKLGANTAGTGICLLSSRQWLKILDKTDLQVLDFSANPRQMPLHPIKKCLLFLKSVRVSHFWLSKL